MNCWIGLGSMTIRAVNKFNTIIKLGSLYQPVNGDKDDSMESAQKVSMLYMYWERPSTS